VQTSGDLRAREGLLALILGTQRHEAGHFEFRDGDFLAAKFGLLGELLAGVFNFVIVAHGVCSFVVVRLNFFEIGNFLNRKT
jgi:hypothetical protein